uniref:E3 ubiquitin-protein ligase KCMF1 n=1 Tax=Drosophila melanogaster TaxID=7227 RepID=Q9W4V2_DROME|eukprot:NP_726832.2 uncharacterized protein Dmel_CG3526, isoform A [Drosophila melanogaster]
MINYRTHELSGSPSMPRRRQIGHTSGHCNVRCDGCGNNRMTFYRYKCLHCLDYDLCSDCKENGVSNGLHSLDHPLQCLMDRDALELHFAGEPIPILCADSFTCPVCGEMGFSVEDLRTHCQDNHRMARTVCICPVCAAVPLSQPSHIAHIANHLMFSPSHRATGDPMIDISATSQAEGSSLPQNSAVSSGSGAQHTFSSSENSQVRFLLPGNRAPLADSDDFNMDNWEV